MPMVPAVGSPWSSGTATIPHVTVTPGSVSTGHAPSVNSPLVDATGTVAVGALLAETDDSDGGSDVVATPAEGLCAMDVSDPNTTAPVTRQTPAMVETRDMPIRVPQRPQAQTRTAVQWVWRGRN